MTFKEICEREKENAVSILFDKAVLCGIMASHVVGKRQDKVLLRRYKARYALHAISLSKDVIVTIDNNYQIGLPSIQYKRKRLHMMRDELVGVV